MAIRTDDPNPSSAYDDCHTTEEIEARYKDLYAEELAKADASGVDVAWDRLPHGRHMELLADLRLAHCRKIREMNGLSPLRPGSPFTGKVRQPKAQVATAPEGAETFACAVCAETKPATKFPTISGRPGVREATCRDCKRGAKDPAAK